jgi:adenosine deaminase
VQGSLEIYLETFAHTVGVMQTPDALQRVASECAQDLAEDGVVYAEIRFAPELHTAKGMNYREVIDNVLLGFAQGEAAAKAKDQISYIRTQVLKIPDEATVWKDRDGNPIKTGSGESWRAGPFPAK